MAAPPPKPREAAAPAPKAPAAVSKRERRNEQRIVDEPGKKAENESNSFCFLIYFWIMRLVLFSGFQGLRYLCQICQWMQCRLSSMNCSRSLVLSKNMEFKSEAPV